MMASYGTFGETRRHRRRNAWWSVIRFLSALVAVLAVGVYAYQVGVSANEARVAQLEADLARAQHDNLGRHDRRASAAEQEAAAAAALESMRQRLAAEIPSGEAADLLAQVRAQLSVCSSVLSKARSLRPRGSFRSTTGWRSTVRNTGSARSASRRGSSKSPARDARCRNPVTNRARAPTTCRRRTPPRPSRMH